MYATEILKQEHRVIERMLSVLEEVARRLQGGGHLDEDVFPQILEFMNIFADVCHHAKEEAELFPVLSQSGIDSEGGLVAALEDEHETVRKIARQMRANWENSDQGESAFAISSEILEYVKLLAQHIEKEDVALFPLTDRMLTPKQQMELAYRFEEVEDEEACRGTYDRYRDLVTELEKRLEIS